MNLRHLTPFVITCLLGMSPVHAAGHKEHAPVATSPTGRLDAANEAAPRLTLLAPRADFLKNGIVYLPFEVSNMTILPIYAEINGEEATKLNPKIGHLHVIVDDIEWSWIHASTDPIYVSTLTPGVHHMTVELADASHNVLERQTIELVVP